MHCAPLMSLESQKEIRVHSEQSTLLGRKIRSPASESCPDVKNMRKLDVLVSRSLTMLLELQVKWS